MNEKFKRNVDSVQACEKEVKRHILMDMIKTFGLEIMLDVVAWGLYVDTFDKDIKREDRKEYVTNKMIEALDKVAG